MTPPTLTRRRALTGVAGLGLAAGTAGPMLDAPASAGAPAIVKPLPAERFIDYGTNAEMRWESVRHDAPRTSPARLFVRNHTATPIINERDYALRIIGDGLHREAVLSVADLKRRFRHTQVTTVHECTGNGRSFFASQQGTPAPGTQWTLGAVGAVTWEGVRLAEVLERIGLRKHARSIQATGLDRSYVEKGVDYGPVRRPFGIHKALDDALLVWGANGHPLLPDHGYPLRLVLPGWVGIASIKWLASLEVSGAQLTSPWNTKWYRMTGGDYPVDSPPLRENPVRSAWELPANAVLPHRGARVLHGRSWSGAGAIASVQVSLDGGRHWQPARVESRGPAWTRWSVRWTGGHRGSTAILARATDVRGRRQPLAARFNDNGYFFDAVVRHPVVVG